MTDSSFTAVAVEALVKMGLVIFGMLTAAAYLVLLERRMAAWVQDRKGPNRVGIPLTNIRLWGLGQPLADGLKIILKEEYTPRHVNRWLFILAPVSILAAALAVFAVVPMGDVLPPIQLGPLEIDRPIPLIVAPGVDVGMIYVFGLSSLAVYGVILGGWASNSKYSFLGGLRSSAQLIAYEVPMGLGILAIVLAAGSLRLESILAAQAQSGWWYLAGQPLGFLVFLIAAFAESARLPFDLPECEQELVGGYHTEYGGIKLLCFLIAEFLHMVVAAFLIVILYLGGWHLWGVTGSEPATTWLQALLRVGILGGKVLAVIVFMMLVRWSWPRFRFDQLMVLAWKVMLPLGLVNLVLVAVLTEFEAELTARLGTVGLVAVSWGIAIAALVLAALLAPLRSDNRPQLDELARGARLIPQDLFEVPRG